MLFHFEMLKNGCTVTLLNSFAQNNRYIETVKLYGHWRLRELNTEDLKPAFPALRALHLGQRCAVFDSTQNVQSLFTEVEAISTVARLH